MRCYTRANCILGAFFVFVILSIIGYYGYYSFISRPHYRFDPKRSDIEFDGNTIVFHMRPEKFTALPYDKRAELLSLQISAVVDYVKARTQCADIVDVLCRLKKIAPGKIQITDKYDSELESVIRCNYLFSTHVRYSLAQEEFIKTMVSSLNREAGMRLDEKDFVRKMTGFSDTGFLRSHMTPDDVRYLERTMTCRDIARAAIGDMTRPDMEKLEALMDWTFVNVSGHFKRTVPGYEDFVDFNDIPLALMLRGMGDCDRSVWVLTRLAYHAGLRSHVVYLHRSGMEGEPSFHTVAEVRTDKGWMAVDPFNNLIYEKGVVRMSVDTDFFKHSRIYANHTSPKAFLPVMKIAETIVQFYIPGQRLFFDVKQSVSTFLVDEFGGGMPSDKPLNYLMAMSNSFAVKMDPYTVSFSRWEFPFWLRGYYYQNAYEIYKYRKLPFLAELREARLAQLLGLYEEAGKMFERLKDIHSEDPRFMEERDYFSILNEFYKKEFSAVERDVIEYRRVHPDSPRMTMLRYVLAHSLKQMNRIHDAMAVYPEGANFRGRGWIGRGIAVKK